MTFHIVVATNLTEEALRILQDAEDVTLHEVAPKTAVVRDYLGHAHALITRDDMRIDAPMLEHGPNLRIIARVSTGINHVDVDTATQRGVLVMNTPGVSAIAASEHTFALLLASCRRLVQMHNIIRDGYWLLDRRQQSGIQLQDKTLGIIGLGRVGNAVAQRAFGFNMTVLAYDPYISEENADQRLQLVGLNELLERSDFVTIHVPLTRDTTGLLDRDALQQMKKGARLINTAHGLIVDEEALAEALKSGHLAGAAVDVFNEEPPYNSPLIGMESVVHTPHVGDNTVEATQDLSLRVVQQVLDALRDEDYRNVINLPLLPGMEYDTVRPYIDLAERMGAILHALARQSVRRIALETRGDEMIGLIKPATVGALVGLLRPILGSQVNVVNAPLLAQSQGWQIVQAKGLRAAEYANLLNVRVTLEDGEEITISGTLLDHRTPTIVQINQYRMNFIPDGDLLLMGSYDKPGVIGRVGTLMSDNGVNIASWHTGRAERGGNTLTVLTLDEPLSEDLLTALAQLDFVRHVHQVQF